MFYSHPTWNEPESIIHKSYLLPMVLTKEILVENAGFLFSVVYQCLNLIFLLT